MPLTKNNLHPAGWILPDTLPDHLAARFPRACRPLLQALQTRGVLNGSSTGPARLTDFFDRAAPAPDPFQLLDMDRAVERILQEVKRGEPIGVFGHYDCDGVTSTALLTEALLLLGASVVPHIPGRNDDYGIPANGVDRLAAAGVRLIVTVDCGIKAIAEVDRARSLGIDIVITDHHQCGQQRLPSGEEMEVLPAACAVVNPRRAGCPYPFKRLAGVGVAFRLAQALAQAANQTSLNATALDKFLDLVCLGTTADVVDLIGENRCLVAQGLNVLREMERPGLKSLAGAAKIDPRRLTARDVAFILAPRLNAAARLEHGKLSLHLLRAPSCDEAAPFAEKLEALNIRRRQLTEEAVREAIEFLASRVETDSILVAPGDWMAGISGLVASRLKEQFGRPALAIAVPPDSHPEDGCVGSARSVTGFDITQALYAAAGRLERFGGHAGAAGFTVKRDQIDALQHALNAYAIEHLSPELIGPRLEIDAHLNLQDLTPELGKQIERFEPCGQGNPPPLFLMQGISPLPGSLRSFENDRYAFRIEGTRGPVRVSGKGVRVPAAFGQGLPCDLVCHIVPDHRSPILFGLSAVDGRPAQVF